MPLGDNAGNHIKTCAFYKVCTGCGSGASGCHVQKCKKPHKNIYSLSCLDPALELTTRSVLGFLSGVAVVQAGIAQPPGAAGLSSVSRVQPGAAGSDLLGAAGCRRVQQGGAVCSRVLQQGVVWQRKVQPGEASSALGENSFTQPPGLAGPGLLQPGAVECSRTLLGAAGCSRVQQGVGRALDPRVLAAQSSRSSCIHSCIIQHNGCGCRQVQHGCSRVPPGATGCSQSFIRRKQPRPAGCSQVWQGAGGAGWVQPGAPWGQPGAAGCGLSCVRKKQLRPAGAARCGEVWTGAAGRSQVQLRCSRAQPGAA